MTDAECVALLRGNSKLNQARQVFSSYSARIEQAQAQRNPIGPIEMRKLEFEAVERIVHIITTSNG